jgi:hypothetical protein
MLAALNDSSSVSIATSHSSATLANARGVRASPGSASFATIRPPSMTNNTMRPPRSHNDDYNDENNDTRSGLGSSGSRAPPERDREATAYFSGFRVNNNKNNDDSRSGNNSDNDDNNDSDENHHRDRDGLGTDDRSHFDAIFAPPVSLLLTLVSASCT